MTKAHKNEPLLNTSLGLLPWLFFIVMQNVASPVNAVIAGGTSWILLMFYFYKIRNNQAVRILLQIIGFVLLVAAAGSLWILAPVNPALLSEIVLLIFLWFFNTFRSKIIRRYLRFESTYTKKKKTISLNELFYVIRICWNTLFLHLIIAFVYFIIPLSYHSTQLDTFVYQYLGIILTVIVIAYEHVRLSIIRKQLNEEEWLPVTNETGRIIGKIAKSVSVNSGNKLLHPIVRIALVYKGKLFLSERPETFLVETGKYDHPFEEHLKFNQTLDDVVGELIPDSLDQIKTRFVFKYVFKNKAVNRLVYLYTVAVHNKEPLHSLNLPQGKIWGEKQIEENLGKGTFSDLFEKEYEILKSTILLAEKIICDKQS